MRKKLLAIIATAAMVVTMIPAMAFAATEVTDLAGLQNAITAGETEITIKAPIKISSGDVTLKDAEGVTIKTAVTDVFEVSDGATLTLGSGIEVDSSSSILYAHDGGIINIDGAELTSTNSPYAVAAALNGGKINVKSGELNGEGMNKVTIDVADAGSEATISGGKVTSNASSVIAAREDGVAKISGGLVETTAAAELTAAYTMAGGKIEMTGGKVKAANDAALDSNGANSSVVVSGGEVEGKTAAVTTDGTGTAVITGGNFNSDVTAFIDKTKLEQDDNGNVVAKGSAAPTTPAAKPDSSPATGDNSMAPIAIAGLVMAAMAAVVATRRRYN